MTVPSTLSTVPRREQVKVVGLSVLRMVVTVALLLALYAALPDTTSKQEVLDGLPLFLGALLVFVVAFAWQIIRIRKSRHPGLRAVEAGVVSLVVFLVVFSSVYLIWDAQTPGSFSEPLQHVKAMYFTVTVFATVGFGDITPTTDPTRIIVSLQMLADLVFIGVAVRILVQVAQRAAKQRTSAQTTQDGPSIAP